MFFFIVAFLLLLFFPTIFQSERMIVLAIIAIGSFFKCYPKFYLSPWVKKMWLITTAASIFFTLFGLLNGCPGATAFIGVFLIYPIVYIYAVSCLDSIDYIEAIHRTIIIAGAIISLLNLIILGNFAFAQLGFINALGDFWEFKFGFETGVYSFHSPIEDISIYIFGYSFSYFFLTKGNKGDKNRTMLLITLLSSLSLAIFTQTRAFWLIIVAMPAIYYFLTKNSHLSHNLFSVGSITVMITLFVGLSYLLMNIFDFEEFADKFKSSFDFQVDDSNFERTMQFKSLLNDVKNSPIIGHGLGWVSSYIRTEAKPWEYEMIYNYLLACFGLIGFLFYLIPTLGIYKKAFRFIKVKPSNGIFLVPQLAGLTTILIANATNPYLLKFDYLWVLFLPIATINILIRESKTIKRNANEIQ